MDISNRFWDKVNKTNQCWLWTSATNGRGYGVMGVNRKPKYAHRISWEMHNGPIPPGLHVCHKCDVPGCVRPDHLFLGTREDNMSDCVIKKRHIAATHPELIPRGEQSGRRKHPESWANVIPDAKLHPEKVQGERNGNAKITDNLVREIRSLYASGAYSQTELAIQFGIKQTTISGIVLKKTWKHIV